MKMLGHLTGNFKLGTLGAPMRPAEACPPHTTLDDLRTARAAQAAEQAAAAQRAFGTKTPAEDVVKKIEPQPRSDKSLTEQLASDGDVRRTRKRSPKPRTNGKKP